MDKKLQQFWLSKSTWIWSFDAWGKVMYPSAFYPEFREYQDEYEKYCSEDDIWWFWMYLNNFDGDLDE